MARHHSIKAEVAPLIAAWRIAGIEALLWKGFYLAEFVYPTPGTRFHGNVGRAAPLARPAPVEAEYGNSEQRLRLPASPHLISPS